MFTAPVLVPLLYFMAHNRKPRRILEGLREL
jgi:hypothetical protein